MKNPAEDLFGGLLAEIFIASILYGVTVLQTFMYFQKYRNDTSMMKGLVAVICVLETAHTAFCILFVYEYLIMHFGDFNYLASINWGMGVTVMTEVVLSVLVQAFYVRRVWIMSNKSTCLSALISILLLIRLGFGIASTIFSYRFPFWEPFRDKTETLVSVSAGLGAAVAVDVLVALTLTYYLLKGRNKWHKESNSRINKIIMYAVNTGAITGAASIIAVTLYAVKPGSLAFLGLVEIQGKLYANSFLGSLNARAAIQRAGTGSQYPSANSYSNQAYRSEGSQNVPQVEAFRHTVVTNDMSVHDLSDNEFHLRPLKGGDLV
ncbi:hypothetical protein C8Q80DRAFT_1158588 [Daedaleopsis nitida]|nr:hypothetical protein C8Q80DRAFT_1158588 [Daedaleopsis nitida]